KALRLDLRRCEAADGHSAHSTGLQYLVVTVGDLVVSDTKQRKTLSLRCRNRPAPRVLGTEPTTTKSCAKRLLTVTVCCAGDAVTVSNVPMAMRTRTNIRAPLLRS